MNHIYRTLILLSIFCMNAFAARATGHTVSVNINNATCASQCNGMATAIVMGGTGPFTYLWMPGNLTTSSISNLCPGSYIVTVTDQSDGSTASANFNIIAPPQITIGLVNSTNPTCSNCNGSATVTASGGVAPYTYQWSPIGGPMPTINNACAGTYTVTATDANGCVGFNTVALIGSAGPTISAINASQWAFCPGGSATLTPVVSGGSPPYTYSWSNPGNTLNNPAASSPVASPTVTTTYTLTVTDVNTCVTTNTVTVTVNTMVAANITYIDPTCNQSNGSLTVNITQGTAPFTVWWSNGPTTTTNSNVPAGIYSCTAMDINGCSVTVSQGLSNVGGPAVTTSVTDNGCTNSSNGAITTSVTGMSPFTYLWSSSQTTSSVSGLTAGNYLVSVTDAVGCVTSTSAQVNTISGNLYMYAGWSAAENCGQPSGRNVLVRSRWCRTVQLCMVERSNHTKRQ